MFELNPQCIPLFDEASEWKLLLCVDLWCRVQGGNSLVSILSLFESESPERLNGAARAVGDRASLYLYACEGMLRPRGPNTNLRSISLRLRLCQRARKRKWLTALSFSAPSGKWVRVKMLLKKADSPRDATSHVYFGRRIFTHGSFLRTHIHATTTWCYSYFWSGDASHGVHCYQ